MKKDERVKRERRNWLFGYRACDLRCDIYHVCPIMRTGKTQSADIKIIFLVSVLYCANRFWLKHMEWSPMIAYLFRCYFNDWLAGIGICAYVNTVLGRSRYCHIQALRIRETVLLCAMCGLLWEYILPEIIPHGTTDAWDVAAYILGGAVYALLRLGR